MAIRNVNTTNGVTTYNAPETLSNIPENNPEHQSSPNDFHEGDVPEYVIYESFDEAKNACSTIFLKPGEAHTEFYKQDNVYHCVVAIGNVDHNDGHLYITDSGSEKSLDERLAEMHDEVIESTKEFTYLVKDVSALRDGIVEFELNVNTSLDEIRQNIENFESFVQTKINEISTDVADAIEYVTEIDLKTTAQIQDISTIVDSFDSRITENSSSIDSINTSIYNIEEHLRNHDDGINDIYNKIETINTSTHEIDDVINNINSSIDEVNEHLTQHDNDINVVNTSISYINSSLDEITNQLDVVNTSINDLTDSLNLHVEHADEMFNVIDSSIIAINEKIEENELNTNDRFAGVDASINENEANIANISLGILNINDDINEIDASILEINESIDTLSNDVSTQFENVNSSISNALNNIEELATTIENVSTSLDETNLSVDEIKVLIENISTNIDNEFSVVNSSIDELRTNINDNAENIETLEQSLANTDSSIIEIRDLIDASVNEINDKLQTVDSSISEINEHVDASVNEINDKFVEVDTSINELRDDINNISTNLQTVNDTIDIINASINDITETLELDVTGINNVIDDINSSIIEIRTNVSTNTQDIENINSSILDINSSINDLAIDLDNKVETIEQALVNVDSSIVEIRDLIDASVNEINTQISDINSSIATANSLILTNTESIANIESDIEAINNSIDEVKDLIDASVNEINNKLTEVDSSIVDLRTDVNANRESIENLEIGLENANSSINEINEHIDASVNEINEQISDINSSITNINTEISQHTEDIENINSSINVLNGSVNDIETILENTIENTSNKLAQLDSSIEILNVSVNLNTENIELINNVLTQVNSSIENITLDVDDKFADVNNHLTEIDLSIGTAKSLIEANANDISEINSSIAIIDSSIEDLYIKVGDNTSHINEIDLQLVDINSSVNASVENINSSINTVNASIDSIENDILSIKYNAQILRNVVNIHDGSINSIDNNIASINSSIVEIIDQLNYIDTLRNEIHNEKVRNDIQDSSIDAINATIEQMLEIMRCRCSDIQKEIERNNVQDISIGILFTLIDDLHNFTPIPDSSIYPLFHYDVYTIDLCCFTEGGHIEINDYIAGVNAGGTSERVAECTPFNEYKTYVTGDKVDFIAVPNEGYAFVKWWIDAVENTHNTRISYVFGDSVHVIGTLLDGFEPDILRHGYTAEFRKLHQLKVTINRSTNTDDTVVQFLNDTLDITITENRVTRHIPIEDALAGRAYYDNGAIVRIVAQPDAEGFHQFVKYVINDGIDVYEQTDDRYTNVDVTTDLFIDAYFIENWITITGDVSPEYAGKCYVNGTHEQVTPTNKKYYLGGSTVTLSTLAWNGFGFDRWFSNKPRLGLFKRDIMTPYTIYDSYIKLKVNPEREEYELVAYFNSGVTVHYAEFYNDSSYTDIFLRDQYEDGSVVTTPYATPTREGYTFEGWVCEDPTFILDESAIYNDVRFHAVWSINKYDVRFFSKSEMCEHFPEVEYNTPFLDLNIWEPGNLEPGDTFVGWMADFSEELINPSTYIIKDNVRFDASILLSVYDVKFVVDSRVIEDISVNHNTQLYEVKPADPSVEGCIFKGWEVDGVIMADDYQIQDNTIFDASLEEIMHHDVTFWLEPNVRYTWVEEVNDCSTLGEVIETEMIDNPTKEGYNFDGWMIDDEIVPNEYPIIADTSFYASFSIKQFTVLFDLNNETGETVVKNASYGDTLSETWDEEDPTYEGHTFAAWLVDGNDVSDDYEIKENITFVARYDEVPVSDKYTFVRFGNFTDGSPYSDYQSLMNLLNYNVNWCSIDGNADFNKIYGRSFKLPDNVNPENTISIATSNSTSGNGDIKFTTLMDVKVLLGSWKNAQESNKVGECSIYIDDEFYKSYSYDLGDLTVINKSDLVENGDIPSNLIEHNIIDVSAGKQVYITVPKKLQTHIVGIYIKSSQALNLNIQDTRNTRKGASNEYGTVTYYIDDNIDEYTDVIEYGVPLSKPDIDISKEGYTFKEWKCLKDDSFIFDNTIVNECLDFKAVWTQNLNR